MIRNVVTSLEAAKEALDSLGLKYKPQNGGLLAQCPAHDDQSPSCSIVPGRTPEQSIVVKCFAGCDWRDIKAALESVSGNRQGPSFVLGVTAGSGALSARTAAAKKSEVKHGKRVEQARYVYRLEDASVAFTKLRFAYPDSPKVGYKTFWISPSDQAALKRLKDQRSVPLYNLPELKRCISAKVPALAGEGEKDCDTAKRHGRTMVCGHAGAGQSLPEEYVDQIRGLSLLWIVPDRDDPGTRYALNWIELARKADVPFRVRRTPLEAKGADLTDHFQAGYGWDDLLDVTDEFLQIEIQQLARGAGADPKAEDAVIPVERVTLRECEDAYRKWMSDAYDMSVVHASLAVRAAHELEGEPVWLLVVAGSASGKTEGITPLAATPNTVMVSEIASPGALLSGTSNSERSKDATGGLLNQIGPTGFLILKDFTSILSMGGDAKAAILAALREIYDGSWSRLVGTDGGKTLRWAGRMSLVGASTTAYDRHHSVIAAMGDRFALIRMDSRTGRNTKGMQALMNTGHEKQMRAELSRAVAGVIAGMDRSPAALNMSELCVLFEAADYVTMARTPAERDYKNDPIEANDPESPARFVKMLQQLVLGGSAIGMHRRDAMLLALRIAHDSIPPIRRKVLDAVHKNPGSSTADVVVATQLPRTSVDRMLQELAIQGLLTKSQGLRHDMTEGGRWRYSLAPGIDPNAITSAALPDSTSGGGAPTETETVALNESIEASTAIAENASRYSDEAFDFTSPEPQYEAGTSMSANIRALFPTDDIEPETCDEHLVAPDRVIRQCGACQELRRGSAA